MSSNTTPNYNEGIDAMKAKGGAVVNELLEMKENTAVTLLTFLTFFVIILAFLYYFYYSGAGTVGGIAIILIITIMLSVVGQAVMGNAGVVAGCIIGILLGMTIFRKMASSKNTRNCNVMDNVYGEKNTAISSLSFNGSTSDGQSELFPLCYYYIKSAYNCCSGGDYRNDYVSLCGLNDLLKQGVRGLDFEIYSIDDQPVVATSTVDKYCVKETFNYVKFSDVVTTIENTAFSETVPNPNDPIIFHLRIKSENTAMYKNLSKIFDGLNGKGLLMGPSFSYEQTDVANNTNFGSINISKMLGKIILIVDRSNPTCLCKDCSESEDCGNFYEFVNMTSNSPNMQLLRYDDIQYTQTPDELILQNSGTMSIGLPNKGSNPDNPSALVMREMGVQMLAMRYQKIDANVEENDFFFNEKGKAFVLKPEGMRPQVVTLKDPPVQDPKLYYTDRVLKTDYYELKV